MARPRRHRDDFNPFEGIATVVLGGFAAAEVIARQACVTCRWASGDGARFECDLRACVTAGEGCDAWEREPGAD